MATSTSSRDAYFAATRLTAFQAVAVKGAVTRSLSIGGHHVRLEFAGGALASLLTAAFAHLPSSPTGPPELLVTAWDSASTKLAMPSPPWTLAAYSARGEIAGFSDERYRTAFQTDIGALSVLDLRVSEGVFWMRDAAELTSTEAAAPFLRILHWWLEARGQQVIHAAAVGAASGGVLIAGAGGAGKSSTALSCLEAGMRYAADDYCLLDGGTIHSLFNSAKVHTHDLERLPFMKPMVGNPDRSDGEKAVCYIHEHRPRQLVNSIPLRAILLPRLTGRPGTTLEPATAAEAVRALAPSTISQLPHAGPAAIRAVADAARRAPAYHLYVGTDARGIAEAISDLLGDSPRAADRA